MTYEEWLAAFAKDKTQEELFEVLKELAKTKDPMLMDLVPYFRAAPRKQAPPWYEILIKEDE